MENDVILEVKHLTKYFDTPKGKLHAVDDVSFTINRGSTLGIVGESGCGKSTTGRTILKLIEPTSGQIIFNGTDITKYKDRQMRKLRTDMQIIFQDPFSSLDPRQNVMQLISEPIREHHICKSKEEVQKRTLEIMDTVGLARRFVNSYPHELDGGRRQRIGIARALSVNPKLIVCDEPVSALDVSIQAQILNLLKQLQRDIGLTYIFITHDLSVVRHISNDIGVMYLGQMVEKTNARELFKNQLHPYTKALLSAIPIPDIHNKSKRIILRGEISTPIDPADECRFSARCNHACEQCRMGQPQLVEAEPNHFVACKRWQELKGKMEADAPAES